MRQLKVYGGLLNNPNPSPDRPSYKRQERVVCAVYSQKELKDIIDGQESQGRISLNWIRDYWCITGNKEELELALAKPHQIIWTGRT